MKAARKALDSSIQGRRKLQVALEAAELDAKPKGRPGKRQRAAFHALKNPRVELTLAKAVGALKNQPPSSQGKGKGKRKGKGRKSQSPGRRGGPPQAGAGEGRRPTRRDLAQDR